jgi:hypothetical protein
MLRSAVLATTLLALLVPGLGPAPAWAAATPAPAMRISRVTAQPTTVSLKGSILFTVTVQGLTLDRLHMGARAVPGRGHLQYYLDRIPATAYRSFRDRSTFLGAIGTSQFLFRLKQSAVRITRGHHIVLIALARNNYLLYRTPVARVSITVR